MPRKKIIDTPEEERARFIAAARELECCESLEAFEATVERIASTPPKTHAQQKKRKKMKPLVILFIAAIGVPCVALAYNGANAYLLSVSPKKQAAQLAKSIGEGCIGKKAFYMGMATTGSARDKAFWSVQCMSGASYVVEVYPDGDGKVLPCSVYEAIGRNQGMRCFKEIEGIH